MELLSKAHDLLVSVDKYELLAAKIDQDDLVDSLLELDALEARGAHRAGDQERDLRRGDQDALLGEQEAPPRRAQPSAATR